MVSNARMLVVAEGDNPSLAYFVRPALTHACVVFDEVDSRVAPPDDLAAYARVVLVRYLPSCWIPALRQYLADGGAITYFMDDDLMDARAHAGLPLRYRWKLARLALWQRATLESLCDSFWVSTPWLARKYASWQPSLISARVDALTRPTWSPESGVPCEPDFVRVCYHGTASHQAEQRWLVSVIRVVQEAHGNIHFSLFGSSQVSRLFRGIERVDVLQPLSWPDYLAWTRAHSADIALAPLLPSAFNAARSPTKFYDHTRLAAVGIYADVVPYHGFIRDGVDGLLLGMSPSAWARLIGELATDPGRRSRIARAACRRVLDDLQVSLPHGK